MIKASAGGGGKGMRIAYSRDEVPGLMAEIDWVVMPSIWWENAPLVIQEAFQHRRPPIVSAIGGMAEMVRSEIDGLLEGEDVLATAAAMRAMGASFTGVTLKVSVVGVVS